MQPLKTSMAMALAMAMAMANMNPTGHNEIIIHKKVVETNRKGAYFHYQLCNPSLNTKNKDLTWMKTAKSWNRDVDCQECLKLKDNRPVVNRGLLKWGLRDQLNI